MRDLRLWRLFNKNNRQLEMEVCIPIILFLNPHSLRTATFPFKNFHLKSKSYWGLLHLFASGCTQWKDSLSNVSANECLQNVLFAKNMFLKTVDGKLCKLLKPLKEATDWFYGVIKRVNVLWNSWSEIRFIALLFQNDSILILKRLRWKFPWKLYFVDNWKI